LTQRAKDSGLLPWMGTIGDADDNAVIEYFWARLQTELLDRRRWKTRLEFANAIFEYLEIFHDRQRRHSALGWRTPIEYAHWRLLRICCASAGIRGRSSAERAADLEWS
jgi:putative transposase